MDKKINKGKKGGTILQDHLGLLFEQSPIGIIEWNNQSEIIDWNHAAEEIFGYSREEASGMRVSTIVEKHLSSKMEAISDEIIRSKGVIQSTNENIRKDGRKIICHWYNIPLLNDDGIVIAQASFVQDVTDREKSRIAEREQRVRAEAFRDVVAALNSDLKLVSVLDQILISVASVVPYDASTIMMIEGDQSVVVRSRGYDQSILGLRFFLSETPNLQRVIETGKPSIINDTHNSDEWVTSPATDWIHSSITAGIMGEGKTIGFVSLESQVQGAYSAMDADNLNTFASQVAIAIRNARLYEGSQKAKEEAEAANQSKSAFLANVSHELRTPLTSVLGFAKIIRKRLEEQVFPNVQIKDERTQKTLQQISENIDIIVAESERLTTLINNVLDLAKIEAGKVEWKSEVVVISEILERAISATSVLFEEKNLKLDLEIEKGLPEIEGDKNRLIQALINLLSNASKFTQQGSVTCQAFKDEDEIVIKIIDTGIGIAEKDLPKVFENFVQVGDTLVEKPQGTGMGLAICKLIINQHGGEVWVESQLGVGSTFVITLPLKSKIKIERTQLEDLTELPPKKLYGLQERAAAPPRSGSDKTKTILIVDDDSNIRKLLRQELEREGYSVIEAENGMEALSQVKNKTDLVILDILLPELNGFDVAAVLRNDPETKGLPIVIVSILEDQGRGYRLGVDRYLTKPVEVSELLEVVKTLLSSNRPSN